LGVTPSAWNSNYRAFDSSVAALTWNTTGVETITTSNAYRHADGSWRYKKTGPAGLSNISPASDKGHQWLTAPSGAAEGVITWDATPLAINASGAVLVNNLKFPATQVASADANTLDDYEEGTWTAAFLAESGTITMDDSYKTGRYTKVGRLVTVLLHARFTAISAPTGSLSVTGLPFASGASIQVRTAGSIVAFDTAAPANTSLMFYLGNSSTAPRLAGFSQTVLAAAGYVQATSEIYLGLSYIVD